MRTIKSQNLYGRTAHKAPKARPIPAWGVAPGADAPTNPRAEGPIYRLNNHPRPGPDAETGQAFVELALVLPMLLLIIVGAAELGRLAYAAIEVNNAARAGVAYAAQSHTTANDTNSIQLAATKEAAIQDAADIGGLTVTVSQSCSCESSAGVMTSFASCDKTVANLTTCPSPSRLVEYVQVHTSASVNTLFHLPGIPNTVTMQGNANMRVEQ